MIGYVLKDGEQPRHPEDFDYAGPGDMVKVAVEHLEALSEHFPPFDRDQVERSVLMAALADDPYPGISALLEGRTDCLVRTEKVEES